jgi:hypothetical protein
MNAIDMKLLMGQVSGVIVTIKMNATVHRQLTASDILVF